jgi:tetratricopeptide (TPR) repeat protein
MRRRTIRHWLAGAAVVALSLVSVSATSVPPELTALPAGAAASLDAGTNAISRGSYEEAVHRLTFAIDSGSLSGEALALAYHHRGIANQKLGQTGSAIFDYTNAIKLNALPKGALARAYYNRGLAVSMSGDRVGAERDYSEAIDLAPDYAAAYHNRANLERERADYPTAIRDYSAALAHLEGEKRKLPLYGRALAYEKSGDAAAAVADLQQALAIDPGYQPARMHLAALAPDASRMAENASDDDIVTGSIAPGGGRFEVGANGGGWRTMAVRFGDNSLLDPSPKSAPAAPLQTASLRPIDMVPAPVADDATPAAVQTAAVDAKAPVARPSASSSGHYRLQLGAFRAPDVAAKAWDSISRKHGDLVTSLDHSVEMADLGPKGTYYRLQAGAFETASDAKSQCAALAASRVDCIVVAR